MEIIKPARKTPNRFPFFKLKTKTSKETEVSRDFIEIQESDVMIINVKKNVQPATNDQSFAQCQAKQEPSGPRKSISTIACRTQEVPAKHDATLHLTKTIETIKLENERLKRENLANLMKIKQLENAKNEFEKQKKTALNEIIVLKEKTKILNNKLIESNSCKSKPLEKSSAEKRVSKYY